MSATSPQAPGHPTMMPEEWVIWGYRLLLGREPESSQVIQVHTEKDFSPRRLREVLMASEEFKALVKQDISTAPEEQELRQLKAEFAVPAQPSHEGSFTDFLGVRTRCSYLPAIYASFSGHVEQPDGTLAVPLHDPAELVALLRSVKEAKSPFTIVELGAGWGPFLVAGAIAARLKGLAARLVGVEGDEAHVGFMHTHLADNGIDPRSGGNTILRAVGGAQDGVAHFPVLPEPSADWGAKASFGDGGTEPNAAGVRYVQVPSVSVRTILRDLDRVDFLHCDIQGAEADALEASADAVDAKVMRVAVGTHGRAIEERLLTLFSARNWTLEFERACTFQEHGQQMLLRNDGVQVWRNRR